jgi:two-component system chemotaxis response regulator CheY
MARILVVDDAAFMRLRLRSILEGAGHQVVEAATGREALTAYAAERPDVVFMDITMPEMDGLEAVRALREQDPGAVVVMCSALGQQAMVLEAVRRGARDFIVKPFQPERVLDAVARLCPADGAGARRTGA